MTTWFENNIVGILSLVVGGIIAYHVYFLSQRINLKDRLAHKDDVRNRVEPLLARIRKGGRSKSELINVKKYLRYYPHSNELNRDGYTYLGAELKALVFDGIEFFCEVRELYRRSDGSLTIKKEEGAIPETRNALVAGVIPYEWIEYVDGGGDEFSYRPQFFTQFRGIDKSPYKYLTYYVESDTYREGSEPLDLKWRRIDI